MKISLIAAVAKNNVIGNKGKIPWHISEDFRHFKELTMGHAIVMGQKTFLSIGKPLPGRTNIVLTKDKNFSHEGCVVAYSPEEAISKAKKIKEVELFVIGGGMVYKTFLPLANKLYLTKIDEEFEGDVLFPILSKEEWNETSKERRFSEEERVNFEFVTLERKNF